MDEIQVDNGDIMLRVEVEGDGPVVLCVHGWPELASSWHHQVRHLAERGYRAAAMDVRLGQIRSDIGGQYRIPIGDPIRESLLFRGGLVREDLADLESRRATIGVSHVTVSASDWHRTVFVDLLREDTHSSSGWMRCAA